MNIITEVKKLKLELDQYIVIGSGILSALGIRATDDVDLVVSQAIYDSYKKQGWSEKNWPMGEPTISNGIYEMGTDWGDDTNTYHLDDLLKNKQILQGVNFVSLEFLKKWKLAKGRSKDLADIKLIDDYLIS